MLITTESSMDINKTQWTEQKAPSLIILCDVLQRSSEENTVECRRFAMNRDNFGMSSSFVLERL